jgi:hypothetical protein
METNKICEKCEGEMRLIPSGFSAAKNKAYKAFWTCDKRNGGCGATARAEGKDVGPVSLTGPKHQGGGDDWPGVAAAVYRMEQELASMHAKLDQLIRAFIPE